MKAATVDGKNGWYDEKTQEFLPDTDWRVGDYEGKSGLFNTKTSEFQPADGLLPTTQPATETTEQTLRRYLGNMNTVTSPALRYGGLMAGGLAAAPANIVAPGVAEVLGGTLGYTAGDALATKLEQIAANKGNPDALTSLVNTGTALKEGLENSIAGPLIGKGLNLAGRGLQNLSSKITGSEDLAKWLYSKALKTPVNAAWARTLPDEDFTRRMATVETGLNGQVAPNELGLSKVSKGIEDINIQVKDKIAQLMKNEVETAPGVMMQRPPEMTPVDKLAKALDPLKTEANLTLNPNNIEQVNLVEQQLRNIPNAAKNYAGELNPEQLQGLKQGIWRDINFDRSKPILESTGRFTEASRKAVGKAAMKELEQLHPELQGLNKQEGAYLDLRKAVEESIARYDKADIAGIGTKALAIRNLGLAALEVITGTPTFKARLAFALKNLAEKGAPNVGKGAAVMLNSSDKNQDPMSTVDQNAITEELKRRGVM